MPEIRVQDEQGTTHVFPDGSTPEMIARAMGLKPPVANLPQGRSAARASLVQSMAMQAAPKPPQAADVGASDVPSQLGAAYAGANMTARIPLDVAKNVVGGTIGAMQGMGNPGAMMPRAMDIADNPLGLIGINKPALTHAAQDRDYPELIRQSVVPPLSALAVSRIGSGLAREAPVSARTVTPAQTEALTSLLDSRAGKIDPHTDISQPALPELRNTAAKIGVSPKDFTGRGGNKLAVRIAQETIQSHDAEVAQITKPFQDLVVSQKPIADAIRSHITPELQANEPKVAARIEDEARKFDNDAPLSQVNATRMRLNKELSAQYRKSESAKINTEVETQSQMAAANAAREVQYGALDRVSGLPPDYVRNLMRREGAVIDASNDIAQRVNKASPQQGEAVSKTWREKIVGTRPSRIAVEHSAIREVFGENPVDVLNTRFKTAFSDLGFHEPAPLYQPPQAKGLLGAGAMPLPSSTEPLSPAGMPQRPMAGTRATRKGLLLPERTSIDLGSRMEGIEPSAPPPPLLQRPPGMIQVRDPKTGRMHWTNLADVPMRP